MRAYKLYAVIAGGDGLAALDIQNAGHIRGVAWHIRVTSLVADGNYVEAELSFMSSNSFSTNDTRGSISMAAIGNSLLTTGMSSVNGNSSIMGLDIPVAPGERIHLHAIQNSALGVINVYCYVEDGTDSLDVRPVRRRR